MVRSSYESPAPLPTDAPGDSPLVCVSVSKGWLPLIVGSLLQLAQPAAWDTSDPAALSAVLLDVQDLLARFGTAGECVALEFRFTDGCVLQYSIDGGETWSDVAGWPTSAPGCYTGATGATGPEGPSGPAPTFRMDGCVLQYSTDGGDTWTAVSGWGSYTADCIPPGPPPNPLDSDTATLACSIAAYMAGQVINAGIQHVVDQINDSKTLVQTVQSFLGLGLLLDVPITLGLELGTLAFNLIQSLNLTDLQTGLDDAAYFEAVQCAIYGAISSDGAITAANWSAVQSAVDAVTAPNAATASAVSGYVDSMTAATAMYLQQQGGIYEGICNCSGTWCYEWDFTSAQGAWLPYDSHTTYSAGVGFVGGYNSSGSPPNTSSGIYVTLPSGTHITDIEWTFTSPNGINSAISSIIMNAGATNVYNVSFGTGVHTSPFTWAVSPNATGDTVYIVLRGNGNVANQLIVGAKLKGTGTNPFGADNCIA